MPPSDVDLSAALDCANGHLPDGFQKPLALTRIPSISTDPACAADCRRAAEGLRDELADLGFAVRVADMAGHPFRSWIWTLSGLAGPLAPTRQEA